MRDYVLNQPYRYGFNGKENDNEVKLDWSGNNINGAQQDYGERIYDPRIGRFLSVDPITGKYPELTSYQFASDRPIDGVDQDGLEWNGAMTLAVAENQKRGENPLEGLRKAGKTTFKDIGNLIYGTLAVVFAPFNYADAINRVEYAKSPEVKAEAQRDAKNILKRQLLILSLRKLAVNCSGSSEKPSAQQFLCLKDLKVGAQNYCLLQC
ncbi:MAG: cell well associated RhsD protein [Mucilaginibacter sp.]|nr:cell well associated RhsD protein [Mucilaginibacter sp.]